MGGRDVSLAASRTEALSVVCHTVGRVKFKDWISERKNYVGNSRFHDALRMGGNNYL